MTDELWTAEDAQTYLGLGSPGSARMTLYRAGIRPVQRATGREGKNLYQAADVRRLHTTRQRGNTEAS